MNGRKRRGRGVGAIFKRADGQWATSITIGYDEQGKRSRRTIYAKTKAEAQKELLQLQTAAASGSLAAPKRMKVLDYLNHWLEDVAGPSIRRSTKVRYSSLIKTHILPHIGGMQLASLQPGLIQNLYRNLEKGVLLQELANSYM